MYRIESLYLIRCFKDDAHYDTVIDYLRTLAIPHEVLVKNGWREHKKLRIIALGAGYEHIATDISNKLDTGLISYKDRAMTYITYKNWDWNTLVTTKDTSVFFYISDGGHKGLIGIRDGIIYRTWPTGSKLYTINTGGSKSYGL